MPETNSKHHWGLVIIGVLLIVCALCLFLIPGITLVTIAVITGIALLVSGVFSIISYIALHNKLQMTGWTLAYGVIDTLLGAMFVIHPLAFATVITWVVGLFMLVSGIFEVSAAIRVKGTESNAWIWTLISGIVTLICAVLFFVWPASIAILLSLFVCLRGISIIMYGVRARNVMGDS